MHASHFADTEHSGFTACPANAAEQSWENITITHGSGTNCRTFHDELLFPASSSLDQMPWQTRCLTMAGSWSLPQFLNKHEVHSMSTGCSLSANTCISKPWGQTVQGALISSSMTVFPNPVRGDPQTVHVFPGREQKHLTVWWSTRTDLRNTEDWCVVLKMLMLFCKFLFLCLFFW